MPTQPFALSLGRALKRARNKRQWSQAKAARIAGLSRNTYRALEGLIPNQYPVEGQASIAAVNAIVTMYYPHVRLHHFCPGTTMAMKPKRPADHKAKWERVL